MPKRGDDSHLLFGMRHIALLPMTTHIFSHESQARLCADFMRQLDEPGCVSTESLSYIATDLEKVLSGVVLKNEVVYAHLVFGGQPLASVPFLNDPSPYDTSIPLSHRGAVYETAKKHEFEISDDEYWSLYLLRPRLGENVYGVAWLSAATQKQVISVKRMLRLMPRLKLFSAFSHSRGTSYMQVQPSK